MIPLIVLVLVLAAACADEPLKVDATHDAAGRLNRLAADLNRDGRPDTWTYMDGTIVLRTEQDLDGDGRIERWEYPGTDGAQARVALSRRKTGAPDLWTFLDSEGRPLRIESASTDAPGTGKTPPVDRVEIYERGQLVRVEEDTDRNGRVDKWEHRDGTTLKSVDFDVDGNGKADERVLFDREGKVIGRQKIG